MNGPDSSDIVLGKHFAAGKGYNRQSSWRFENHIEELSLSIKLQEEVVLLQGALALQGELF